MKRLKLLFHDSYDDGRLNGIESVVCPIEICPERIGTDPLVAFLVLYNERLPATLLVDGRDALGAQKTLAARIRTEPLFVEIGYPTVPHNKWLKLEYVDTWGDDGFEDMVVIPLNRYLRDHSVEPRWEKPSDEDIEWAEKVLASQDQ